MKLVQIHIADEFFVIYGLSVSFHFLRKSLLSVHVPGSIHLAVSEFKGHVFVHLVFQQLLNQFCSGILFLAVLVHFLGQQHLALDVDQRRRHHQEFTHDIHVFPLHLPDVIQILRRNLYDRDIIDVYFIFFDQMKQQIQWTFKRFQFYRYCHLIKLLFPLVRHKLHF